MKLIDAKPGDIIQGRIVEYVEERQFGYAEGRKELGPCIVVFFLDGWHCYLPDMEIDETCPAQSTSAPETSTRQS